MGLRSILPEQYTKSCLFPPGWCGWHVPALEPDHQPKLLQSFPQLIPQFLPRIFDGQFTCRAILPVSLRCDFQIVKDISLIVLKLSTKIERKTENFGGDCSWSISENQLWCSESVALEDCFPSLMLQLNFDKSNITAAAQVSICSFIQRRFNLEAFLDNRKLPWVKIQFYKLLVLCLILIFISACGKKQIFYKGQGYRTKTWLHTDWTVLEWTSGMCFVHTSSQKRDMSYKNS